MNELLDKILAIQLTEQIEAALEEWDSKKRSMGCVAATNWFVKRVPGFRPIRLTRYTEDGEPFEHVVATDGKIRIDLVPECDVPDEGPIPAAVEEAVATEVGPQQKLLQKYKDKVGKLELSYLLTYGTLEESIEESSIDYPKSDLDLSVWEKEAEGYILRPEVKDKIFKTLDAYEPVDLLDIAREIRIVGSMGSNLYAEDADIDIHLVPNDFSEWNEDKVQEVKKWFISHAQELGAFVGKHPIEVYIQLDPVQDLLSAGVYDMFADEWLVGPKLVSKDYDPYEDFSHIADDIRQNVQDADILMGELKRDVIDYDVISKAMGEMPADVKKRLHLKLKNKLIEIEKDIEGMYAKRKEWTDARKEASKPKTPEEALKNVELAKKWRDTNATFKFISRYQYMKIIQDLEELIADDGVVSPDEVDVIRNIVGA